jgi:hypothetical protein
MTINEAYNKGLDDAEIRIIETIKNYIDNGEYTPFPNPSLQEVWSELLSKQTQNGSDDGFRDKLYQVLLGEDIDVEDEVLLKVVKARSDHFRSICGGRSRVGKDFKKRLEEQLHSMKP